MHCFSSLLNTFLRLQSENVLGALLWGERNFSKVSPSKIFYFSGRRFNFRIIMVCSLYISKLKSFNMHFIRPYQSLIIKLFSKQVLLRKRWVYLIFKIFWESINMDDLRLKPKVQSAWIQSQDLFYKKPRCVPEIHHQCYQQCKQGFLFLSFIQYLPEAEKLRTHYNKETSIKLF